MPAQADLIAEVAGNQVDFYSKLCHVWNLVSEYHPTGRHPCKLAKKLRKTGAQSNLML